MQPLSVEAEDPPAVLPAPDITESAAAVRTLQLSKSFGSTVALAGLTMTVARGEVFGFLGPNGAGKTTAVHPALAAFFICGQALALMTLALLGSTRLAPITCEILAITLFFIAWIAGIAGQIGALRQSRHW